MDKEVDSKLTCFLLELSEGLPPDEMYKTFYAKCSFRIGEEVTYQMWKDFFKQNLPGLFGKELLSRVTEECSHKIKSVQLSWEISLEWLRNRNALLTPQVKCENDAIMPFLDAITEGKDNAKFILIGEAHAGKTTAILDTANRLTENRGSSKGGIVLALQLLDCPPVNWRDAINHVVRKQLNRSPFPWSDAAAEEKFLFIDGLDDGQNLDAHTVEQLLIGIKAFPGIIVLSARPEWYRSFQTVLHRTLDELITLELIQYSTDELEKLTTAVSGHMRNGVDDMPLKTPLQAVIKGRLQSSSRKIRIDQPHEEHFVREHAAVLWTKLRGQRNTAGTDMIMDMWTTGVIHAYREAYQDPIIEAKQRIVSELANHHQISDEESRRVLQEIFYLNDELDAIQGTQHRFYDDALASRAVIKAAQSGNHMKLQEALLIPPWYGFQEALRRRIEWAVTHGEATATDVFESLQRYAQNASRASSMLEEAALSSAIFLIGQIADVHREFQDKGIKALQNLLYQITPNSFCHIGILFALMILGEWSAEEMLTKALCENKDVADRNARFHLAYFKVVKPSWSFMTGRTTIEKCDCSMALDDIVRYLTRGEMKDAIRARVYVRLFLDILNDYHCNPNMTRTRSEEMQRIAKAISDLRVNAETLSHEVRQQIHSILAGAETMIASM